MGIIILFLIIIFHFIDADHENAKSFEKERVRTMGNNLNKNPKNVIFNLNNNIHKYYLNSHQNRSNNNDFSQSPMIIENPKAKSGTINSLLVLNSHKINNKEFNLIIQNNLNSVDENNNIKKHINVENK